MLFSTLLPYGVVASHIVFVLIILALITRPEWSKKILSSIKQHALVWGAVISAFAVFGSLYYSEVIGYAPCELCWWQRIFIFPQLILFLVALKHKARDVFTYSIHLSFFSALVALYQLYVQYGGRSFLACTAAGGACTKVYVNALGYVTIPLMSLTISAYLLLLAYIYKKYDNSSHA